MHPIWFVQWAWEKAWSEDGLFTLVEHNQGFLSLAALGVALWAFIAETKRANIAKAEAEAAERERRREAEEAREEQRAREEARRLQAVVDARRADEARRLNHLLDFVNTVNGIIGEVQREMVVDRLTATAEGGAHLMFPSGDLRTMARAAAGALNAIVSAAPPHPKAMLDAREVGERLAMLGEGPQARGPDGISLINRMDEMLNEAKTRMSDHHRALVAELRPELMIVHGPAPAEPHI